MKIHHVLNSFETGGAEMLVARLAAVQRQSGHELKVHSISGVDGPISRVLDRLQVPYQIHEGGPWYARAKQLANALARDKPSIIHTHNAAPTLIGCLASLRLIGVKVIRTEHGASSMIPSRLQRMICSRLSASVVAVSDTVAEHLLNTQSANANKIRVITNGAAPPSEESSEAIESNRPACRLISVGRLVWEKDFPTLIRAHARVVQNLPGSELWIVGEGVERNRLELLIAELGLENRVRLLGSHSNIGFWLKQADIFVMSSVSEGLPISLLEALSVGLPCIVTEVGGMPEVIHQSGAGLSVPPSDPNMLADAILALARNPNCRAELAARARSAYQEHYTIERMAEQYLQVYIENKA
jgi:L-malate glycosyltransferase